MVNGVWQVVRGMPSSRPVQRAELVQVPDFAAENTADSGMQQQSLPHDPQQVQAYNAAFASYNAAEQQWMLYLQQQDRALAFLHQHLHPQYHAVISESETPYHAWQTLNKYFNAPTMSKLLQKLQQLYAARMTEGSSIKIHLLYL